MSPLWPGVAFGVGLVLGVLRSRSAVRDPAAAPVRPNHAGRPVPVVLGRALVTSANAASVTALLLAVLAGPVSDWPLAVVLLAATGALLLAGARDDRSQDPARGLRSHIGALFRGQPTTGVLKLVVAGAASVWVAAVLGGGPTRGAVAALAIGLSVNVTNALDVRPGRALKWALLILIPVLLLSRDAAFSLVGWAYVGAALATLPYDLAERGMLGDAGSNPLGVAVGVALAVALPFPALIVATAVLAGLQLAAETVTISRLIETVTPVRWLDRLGRRN